MPAARSLDSLPFDIFYEIATSLDDRDFINLSRTNRALRDLAQSDLVARKTVEVSKGKYFPARDESLLLHRTFSCSARRDNQP